MVDVRLQAPRPGGHGLAMAALVKESAQVATATEHPRDQQAVP